ncbi:hypothetical protein EC396_03150 [Lutibacter sp. HS1-25]|uniref:hypothetical protein n=1 Tax=Lutibacter sp. HS1-25 TaxID=2485000 RepID=UPI001011A7A4|nr:hypothetical protein [Lutibacter sp. HS1-25]RXP62729.1 hypothetical protein EC396_03150 [Lutibacter sp. HS1-25]
MIRVLIFLVIILRCFFVNAQIVTYQPSSNISNDNPYIFSSPYYKVQISQNNEIKDVFVYAMNAMHITNNSKSTSWVNFSFEGTIKVKVTVLKKNVDFAQVLPRKANISVAIIGENSIEFEISKDGYYSVEFEKGIFIEHPLLIFANPLEKDVPKKNDPNVIYFEAGYHEIGDKYMIPSNKTVYLEGGAYLKGQFFAENAENIKIKGRGILSGEAYKARTHNHMIRVDDSENIEIEGVTIIHAPRYMISSSGIKHHFHHIKMMGWWFSTDGISSGENSLIENCFFKVNDDAVKLYRNNMEVKNCVIWQLENGAAFMISWNGSANFGNVKVQNIDIIRVEHHWDNENLAVFAAIHGSKAHISNFLVKDVRIDNANWRMFHLVTRPNRWGKWDQNLGSLSNFTFKNITYYGEQKIPSLLMGHDVKHPVYNITFENITINGKKMLIENDFLIVDKKTTSNIKIK